MKNFHKVMNGKIAFVRVGSTSGNIQSITCTCSVDVCPINNLYRENLITVHNKLIVILLAL